MVVVAEVNVHAENASKVPRTPPVVGKAIDHEGGQQLHPPSLADAFPPIPADRALDKVGRLGQSALVTEAAVDDELGRLTQRLHDGGWAAHVTVARLIRGWQQLADEVSTYRLTIDDYTNDVTGRDALELVLGWASDAVVELIGPQIADADRRFEAGTIDDGGEAISQFFHTEGLSGWWWQRRPRSGALSDYLDRRR